MAISSDTLNLMDKCVYAVRMTDPESPNQNYPTDRPHGYIGEE